MSTHDKFVPDPSWPSIVELAIELWGEPNRSLSHRDDVRFGGNGSKSVKPSAFMWKDHESGDGGGYVEIWRRARHGAPLPKRSQPINGHDSFTSMITYEYRDEGGRLLFEVVRKPGHKFTQRSPDPSAPDGWKWSTKGLRRVLYRLPELLAADPARVVFVAEGEKDVGNLRHLGLVATCNPGGAGKWGDSYAPALVGRDVTILPDNDKPGQDHAEAVAAALHGVARSVRVLMLPGLPVKGDVSDWLSAGGTAEALERLAEAAPLWKSKPTPAGDDEDLDAVIKRLARLRPIEYGRERENAAKILGCRVSDIDLEVKRERGEADVETDTRGQGRPLDLQPPEPCPEAVDGPAMLTELEDYFRRHLVLPDDGAALLALWSIHTHCFTSWRYTPRLNITAATKNSGKSRVLALMRMVAAKPLRCENITPAAVFRTIDAAHPTLLIDEADQFLVEMPDLIGVLNGGHERGGQTIRTVLIGDALEPRLFDTYSPVAIAGIGRLPGTLASRCIRLEMQRARRGDMPPDIEAASEAQGDRLTRQIARWVSDSLPALEAARPDTAGLINRVRNNWQPLFAIADVVGGGWPELARKAAKSLDVADDDADSLGEQLLADIRSIYFADFSKAVDARREPTHWLSSDAIVQRLVALEGRPWAELGRERKPITKNRLARLLRSFKVYPGKVGPEAERVNGYLLTAFDEVFERHLPPQTGTAP